MYYFIPFEETAIKTVYANDKLVWSLDSPSKLSWNPAIPIYVGPDEEVRFKVTVLYLEIDYDTVCKRYGYKTCVAAEHTQSVTITKDMMEHQFILCQNLNARNVEHYRSYEKPLPNPDADWCCMSEDLRKNSLIRAGEYFKSIGFDPEDDPDYSGFYDESEANQKMLALCRRQPTFMQRLGMCSNNRFVEIKKLASELERTSSIARRILDRNCNHVGTLAKYLDLSAEEHDATVFMDLF